MEKDLSEKANGGTNDFESMMEQRPARPRATGDVLIGTVLLITRDNVIIDINYKCEGQVPLAEFLDHDGNVTVKEGDEVDVFFRRHRDRKWHGDAVSRQGREVQGMA